MFEKKIIMTLDTETAPLCPSTTVDPHNMLVYDIGYTITDISGENVLATRSFIVAEIFFGEQERMNSAYYANKIPLYIKDIAKGDRIVLPFKSIKIIIEKDIEKYGVKYVQAYNTFFDLTSLNTTLKYLTNSAEYYFFSEKIIFWDILRMISPIVSTAKYKEWCIENNFLTKRGISKKSAEIVYRYITKDNDFVEEHKSIEDVRIELEIYKAVRRKKKKIRRELFNKDVK